MAFRRLSPRITRLQHETVSANLPTSVACRRGVTASGCRRDATTSSTPNGDWARRSHFGALGRSPLGCRCHLGRSRKTSSSKPTLWRLGLGKARGSTGIEVEREWADHKRVEDVLQWGWFGRPRACDGWVPKNLLVEIDLRRNAANIRFDGTGWKTRAFEETNTSNALFEDAIVTEADVIGDPGWYIDRPGFWHGACGPAACWAGGAIGLVDFAVRQNRDDAHTLAHLGALHACQWGLKSHLDQAGREIDVDPTNVSEAEIRALSLRHLIEQLCTDVLRRIPRAFGPFSSSDGRAYLA